jgi:hypothetical protein
MIEYREILGASLEHCPWLKVHIHILSWKKSKNQSSYLF